MSDSMLFLENESVRLCCERRGSGARRVLFAHGWISSRRMWYEVVDRLDPALFTVDLLDFRGCGRSDRPRAHNEIENYASDLRTALASIDAPVTLVGHSMGGRLAQYLAAERPANLERLILVAPGTANGTPPSARHRALTLETYGSRQRIERFQRAAMHREVANTMMERIVDDALMASYDHWMGWYDHGRAVDFSDRLSAITVPTLAIGGTNDPLVPPSRVKRDVADAIDGALFALLHAAGHNLPIEAPDDIAQAVRRFGQ
ncbi:MAG TPA: alpha/beta hydrolase [Candidatus Baltobacteraceae bacterium]|nr:alpha/beta hydrolase [Candidatus Baltobacteraceae bacterium]